MLMEATYSTNIFHIHNEHSHVLAHDPLLHHEILWTSSHGLCWYFGSTCQPQSAGAGAQQQQGETDTSDKAGEGEPVRTVDVPAAGQPIRQNQAAVRERLMPKLAELEQVRKLHLHDLLHSCLALAALLLAAYSAEADQVRRLFKYMLPFSQPAIRCHKQCLPEPMELEQGTLIF